MIEAMACGTQCSHSITWSVRPVIDPGVTSHIVGLYSGKSCSKNLARHSRLNDRCQSALAKIRKRQFSSPHAMASCYIDL